MRRTHDHIISIFAREALMAAFACVSSEMKSAVGHSSGLCDEMVQFGSEKEQEEKKQQERRRKRSRHRAAGCDRWEAFPLQVEAGAEADARFRG